MLLIGLQLGGTQYPWNSPLVICLITFGTIGFGIFALVEKHYARHPLIPLHFFTDRSRFASLSVNVAQAMITAAAKYFLPLYYQLVLGASPLMSGIYLLPYALILSPCFPLVGYTVKRTGKYQACIWVGSLCLVVGSAIMLAAKPYTDWALIFVPQVFLAIGQGLAYQTPLIAFQAQIEQCDVATGTSAYEFLRSSSQMVSIVLGQVIFQTQVQQRQTQFQSLVLSAALVEQLASGNAIAATTMIQHLNKKQQGIVYDVLVSAFNRMWVLYVVIGILGVAAGLCVKESDVSNPTRLKIEATPLDSLIHFEDAL